MGEFVPESNDDSQDAKVINLQDYRQPETVNPAELTDEDMIASLLSALSHPSVTGDPGRIARQIITLLSEPSTEASVEWTERIGRLSVDVKEIDDEAYDAVSSDEIVTSAIALIGSKNGHYEGNEDILDAARALIDLRAGIVLNYENLKGVDVERWVKVIESLGGVAIKAE